MTRLTLHHNETEYSCQLKSQVHTGENTPVKERTCLHQLALYNNFVSMQLHQQQV